MGHMPLDEHATFGSLDQDVLADVLKIPAPALEINRFHNVIESTSWVSAPYSSRLP